MEFSGVVSRNPSKSHPIYLPFAIEVIFSALMVN